MIAKLSAQLFTYSAQSSAGNVFKVVNVPQENSDMKTFLQTLEIVIRANVIHMENFTN